MIIAVLLKQIAFVRSRTGSDPEKRFVSESDRVTLNNPMDEAALMQAVKIKNAASENEIWVLSQGEHLHELEAQRALALGADHFVHIADSSWKGLDAWATAAILTRAVEKVNAGLVFCGAASLDRGMGEVGAFAAHQLGVPYIGNVVKCFPKEGKHLLMVERALEQGAREILEAETPLFIGVGAGAAPPGYPSFSARRAVRNRTIVHWGASDLESSAPASGADTPRVRLGAIASPRPRSRRITVPDGRMSAYERIDWLLAGAEGSKSGAIIEGEPGEMARRLFEFLLEKQLIPQAEKE